MLAWITGAAKKVVVLGGAPHCGKTAVAKAIAQEDNSIEITELSGSRREMDRTLPESLKTANGVVFVYRGTDAHWKSEETFLKQIIHSDIVKSRGLPVFIIFSKYFVSEAKVPAHPLSITKEESLATVLLAGSIKKEIIAEKIKEFCI